MKKMVIRNIQVVGMHHYRRRELDRLATYHIELEPNYRYYSYAVAVFDGPRKCGNLKRDCARAVYDILVENKAKSKYFLRPLKEARVHNRRTGPQQTCAVAFKVEDGDIAQLSSAASKYNCINTKVMELPRKAER